MRRIVALLGLVLLGACSSSSHRSQAPSTTPAPTASTTPTTSSPHAPSARWSTYYGDNARTGFATEGPVHPDKIQQQWASPELDGDIYAQPLVVGNTVFVATENNTVYALNLSDGSIVWHRHLGEPVPASDLPCGDVDPVGITSTPVVDVRARRVYAVGMIRPAQHVLWALDAETGKLLAHTPVDAPGSDPRAQNQRSALTLSGGKVFVPFGGRFGDCGDYHGRVVSVAVTADGVGAVASYTLPTQGRGGFWVPPGMTQMSDGSFLLASGNSASSTTYDYGNSVVRLNPALKLIDSFAPSDWADLNATDGDLGTTQPVLLPNHRVFQVGKHGIGYLLDVNHLGGIGGELFQGDVCHGSTAYGGVAHDGNTLFVACSNGVVEVIVSGDRFKTGWSAGLSTPGPTVVTKTTVWTMATGPGRLIALDRATGNQLAAEYVGPAVSRFIAPTVAAGRVFIAPSRHVFTFG
jgi:outer membrane protein assembly factor BamB